ncbi:MAG TPA: hypothetical protein VNJ04_18470 [Gemmatimonadaceae bacterium]|nr:hypothetical protein [Gemmatimonadaceae bacterium]
MTREDVLAALAALDRLRAERAMRPLVVHLIVDERGDEVGRLYRGAGA